MKPTKCTQCDSKKLTWYGELLRCDNCGSNEATRHFVPAGLRKGGGGLRPFTNEERKLGRKPESKP